MYDLPEIELIPAYVWDCEFCGKENFERGIVIELSDENLETLRTEYGVEADAVGDFMTMPEFVTCEHCDNLFRTRHYHG